MAYTRIFATISLLVVVSRLGLVSAVGREDNAFGCNGQFCVSVPENCISIDCELGVRFEMLIAGDPTINVHAGAIAQTSLNYVAIGFSKDEQMGNDAVIMCNPMANSTITTMVTPAASHTPPIAQQFSDGTPTGNTLFKGNRVDCSFILPVRFDAGNGIAFDLTKDPAYVFVVTGPISSDTKLINAPIIPLKHMKRIIGHVTPEKLGTHAAIVRPASKGPSPSATANTLSGSINTIIVFISTFLVTAFAILP